MKRLPGMASLSYEQRLLQLNTTTLKHARVDADLLFLFRTIHGLYGVDLNTVQSVCNSLQITNGVGAVGCFNRV